jgi:hypothetical protein
VECKAQCDAEAERVVMGLRSCNECCIGPAFECLVAFIHCRDLERTLVDVIDDELRWKPHLISAIMYNPLLHDTDPQHVHA